MINYPKTLEEARAYRYGKWAGNPKGYPYNENKCAREIADNSGFRLFRQCSRRNGHGPDGLYCKIHAKMIAKRETK